MGDLPGEQGGRVGLIGGRKGHAVWGLVLTLGGRDDVVVGEVGVLFVEGWGVLEGIVEEFGVAFSASAGTEEEAGEKGTKGFHFFLDGGGAGGW